MNPLPKQLIAAAVCAGYLLNGIATGASPYAAAFDEARAIYEGIYDQALVERRVCEEELAQGVEERLWNDEETRTAEEWLRTSFEEISDQGHITQQPQSRVAIDSRWSRLRDILARNRGPTTLNNAACIRFSERMQLMDYARNAAAREMCEAAIFYAEDVWLNAKKRADLGPAILALDNFKRATRGRFETLASNGRFQTRRRTSTEAFRHEISEELILEAIALRSVIDIPEPLSAPDPENQLVAFWEFRQTWHDLTRINHPFVRRPRVAGWFAELNVRFLNALEVRRNQLDDLILAETAAADFERILASLPGKPDPMNARRAGRGSYDQPPNYGRPPSYRELLAKHGPPSRNEGTPDYEAYAKWLTFKKAEESGDKEILRSALRDLERERSGFSPRVAVYITQRLTNHPAVDSNFSESRNPANAQLKVPSVSSGDPVKDLVEVFTLDPAYERARKTWSLVLRGDPNPVTSEGGTNYDIWRGIVAMKNSDVLALRDLATRHALGKIMASPSDISSTGPLDVLLLNALEEAFAKGSRTQARLLLQLDFASCSLRFDEHKAYRELIKLLPDSHNAPGSLSDESSAERNRALLAQSISPAAARFAAEQLKKGKP